LSLSGVLSASTRIKVPAWMAIGKQEPPMEVNPNGHEPHTREPGVFKHSVPLLQPPLLIKHSLISSHGPPAGPLKPESHKHEKGEEDPGEEWDRSAHTVHAAEPIVDL